MSKVKLGDFRELKELTLNTTGVTVKFYTTLLVGDIENIDPEHADTSFGIKTLLKLIKEWNATDEEGNDLPISLENINKLPVSDLEQIIDVVKESQEREKKS